MNKIFKLLILVLILTSCSGPLFITEKNIELFNIEVDGKVGYIDQKGKVRIEPIYDKGNMEFYFEDEITEYFTAEEYAIVKKDGKFGLIDWQGNLVLAIEQETLIDEWDGTFASTVDGKYGIISSTGEVLVPHLFDSYFFIDAHKICPGQIDDFYVLYDPKNRSIIETEYVLDYISPFFDEYAEVEILGRFGLIDTLGNVVLEVKYDKLDHFYIDRIPVIENGFAKYINLKGENVFDEVYDECYRFEDAYAVVRKDGAYGVIDTLGNIVIPYVYTFLQNEGDEIFEFSNSEDYYMPESKSGLINIKQDTILDCKYSYIFLYEGVAEVETGEEGTCGAVRIKNQKEIIPLVFNSVDYYSDIPTKVFFDDGKGNEFFGYINKRNKIIWSNNEELLKQKLKSKNK